MIRFVRPAMMTVLITLATVCFVSAAILDERPELSVTAVPKTVDLGTVNVGSSNVCHVALRNTGRSAAHIVKTSSTCGCAVAKTSQSDLTPGSVVDLHVTVKAGASSGTVTRLVYVEVTNQQKTRFNIVEVPIRLTVQTTQPAT